MKFLLDKVACGGSEWRLVADTKSRNVWILGDGCVYEFASRHDAYQHIAGIYRKVADMRNMQPGQSYSLTMADGRMRTVQVQNQTPQGVDVMDPETGETLNIPHIQMGAEPKPVMPNKAKVPGSPGGPTPTPNATQPNSVQRSYALCTNDLRVTGAEIGRQPYQCKHDGGYLYRKEPSAPEKYCAQCGMVYAAERKTAASNVDDNKCTDCGKRPGRPPFALCGPCKQKRDRRLREEDKKTAGCDSDYWVEGDHCDCPAHKGKKTSTTRRQMFRAWKNKERIVRAFDVKASPPMPGSQAMPSAEVSNDSQTMLDQQMNEKGPGEFAEEPDSGSRGANPNAKRKLTPHEVIEEAESLIRNALAKGVKIGAADLQEYMQQYYANHPEELLKGIALAWQKVQYEESMEDESDPNAPQGEGFGPQPPTTPEEAAQMAPKNGPIQTRKML